MGEGERYHSGSSGPTFLPKKGHPRAHCLSPLNISSSCLQDISMGVNYRNSFIWLLCIYLSIKI